MQIERKYALGFDTEWDIAAVRTALCDARHIVLVAHTHADGDAVGSLTGMYQLCLRLDGAAGRTVTAMLPDGVPDDLLWLPCTDKVLHGKADAARCREAIVEADLIVGLDISGLGRTDTLEEALRASTARKILVDHHINPEREAFDTVVSEHEASSTCELVYWLMRETFGKELFTKDAATSLYTGICTDTGTFSFSNDRASVYLAAAELLEYGIDPKGINLSIKNVFTVPRMRFYGHALSECLTVYEKQKVALMTLSADEMRRYGVTSAELTGLINEVMKLKDVDCGVLVREDTDDELEGVQRERRVRLSLRSKEIYDVNLLAGEMFGGGGHMRAAGATSTASLEETVEIVKRKLQLSK